MKTSVRQKSTWKTKSHDFPQNKLKISKKMFSGNTHDFLTCLGAQTDRKICSFVNFGGYWFKSVLDTSTQPSEFSKEKAIVIHFEEMKKMIVPSNILQKTNICSTSVQHIVSILNFKRKVRYFGQSECTNLLRASEQWFFVSFPPLFFSEPRKNFPSSQQLQMLTIKVTLCCIFQNRKFMSQILDEFCF